jgi:hypothetical protein
MQYLRKGTFFLFETFRIFWEALDLSMGEISGQNSFIWFFWCLSAIDEKSSKADITFERSNRNSNPCRIFTRALYSIYRQKLIEIGGWYLGRFPRQSVCRCSTEHWCQWSQCHWWYQCTGCVSASVHTAVGVTSVSVPSVSVLTGTEKTLTPKPSVCTEGP